MKSAAHAEDASMHTLRQCGYNGVSHVTVGALLRPKGGQKVATRWVTTNQTDGTAENVLAESVYVRCPYEMDNTPNKNPTSRNDVRGDTMPATIPATMPATTMLMTTMMIPSQRSFFSVCSVVTVVSVCVCVHVYVHASVFVLPSEPPSIDGRLPNRLADYPVVVKRRHGYETSITTKDRCGTDACWLIRSDESVSILVPSSRPRLRRVSVQAKQNGCMVAMNGGPFHRDGSSVGLVSMNGTVISNGTTKFPGFGTTRDGAAFVLGAFQSATDLASHDVLDFVTGFDWLVWDGAVLVPPDDPTGAVRAPRSAIGVDYDSNTLLLVVDGCEKWWVGCHTMCCVVHVVSYSEKKPNLSNLIDYALTIRYLRVSTYDVMLCVLIDSHTACICRLLPCSSSKPRGPTLRELAAFMINAGASYAINMDGGGSTTLVVNGTVVNRPHCLDRWLVCERPVSTVVCIRSDRPFVRTSEWH